MNIKRKIKRAFLRKIGVDDLLEYMHDLGYTIDIGFRKVPDITPANMFERIESYNAFIVDV